MKRLPEKLPAEYEDARALCAEAVGFVFGSREAAALEAGYASGSYPTRVLRGGPGNVSRPVLERMYYTVRIRAARIAALINEGGAAEAAPPSPNTERGVRP